MEKEIMAWICTFLIVLLSAEHVYSEEFTFELPDRERMCFTEVVKKDTTCKLEFQVIEGGNYDVDVVITSPRGARLYDETKQQYDNYDWVADSDGEYTFCFSNEFSTFTHKIVYFDFLAGDDDMVLPPENPTAVTQLESSIILVHKNLRQTTDYQTHHRLRESQGRSFAEDLNERVQYWSIGQTVIILLAGFGQLFILKSLFTEKRGSSATRT